MSMRALDCFALFDLTVDPNYKSNWKSFAGKLTHPIFIPQALCKFLWPFDRYSILSIRMLLYITKSLRGFVVQTALPGGTNLEAYVVDTPKSLSLQHPSLFDVH